MKSTWMVVAAGLLIASAAAAQPYGMGPGMMGAYGGGYGPGPGMMGGYGAGYGPGSGMMGGYGPNGSGPAMMWGGAGHPFAGLDLSPDQRKQIEQIEEETGRAQWQLMGAMHEQGFRMHGLFGPGSLDEAAARKAFDRMTETQKAMFNLALEARKRIDAVLTPEQRARLQGTRR